MTDRHTEKPLSIRLGADRKRLEAYAARAGVPVRRVIADAVREKLDRELDARKAELRAQWDCLGNDGGRQRLYRMAEAEAEAEADGAQDPGWESLWAFTGPDDGPQNGR